MCDMTPRRVWLDSFICVTWRIDMFTMTHLFDEAIFGIWLGHVLFKHYLLHRDTSGGDADDTGHGTPQFRLHTHIQPTHEREDIALACCWPQPIRGTHLLMHACVEFARRASRQREGVCIIDNRADVDDITPNPACKLLVWFQILLHLAGHLAWHGHCRTALSHLSFCAYHWKRHIRSKVQLIYWLCLAFVLVLLGLIHEESLVARL